MVELLHGDITAEILGAAFEVHRELGLYKSALIGQHRLDLLVDGSVIVELKTIKDMDDIHKAIVQSYLKATKLSVALILNFAKASLEHKRLVRTAT